MHIEQARNTKRTIDRAARKVDRERKKLEANETKTLNEIKKLAKINKHVFIYVFYLLDSS